MTEVCEVETFRHPAQETSSDAAQLMSPSDSFPLEGRRSSSWGLSVRVS